MSNTGNLEILLENLRFCGTRIEEHCSNSREKLVNTRVSQKVMSPVNFNRFNLHIFSRNFKGV